jgi:hypothetical protein
MKKIVMVVAAAALSIPLFAQNKVGKVTGIQVKDNEAIVSLAEGLLNPFEEGGFTKSGDSSVTVPIDVAVEFYFPKMGKAPEGFPPRDADENRDDSRRPEFPKLEVKNLRIDQLVQIVYAEDGKTVEKIQLQPMMPAFHPGMAHFGPGSFRDKDDDRFKSGDNKFKSGSKFRGRGSSKSDSSSKGKDPAHPTSQRNWR